MVIRVAEYSISLIHILAINVQDLGITVKNAERRQVSHGDPITSKCIREIIKCPNCIFSNEKFETNYNTNHCAIDTDLCEILKSKIKKYIEMTDYPVQPTFQRYFGKVERAMNQQSITPTRVRKVQAAIRQAYSAHPFQRPQ